MEDSGAQRTQYLWIRRITSGWERDAAAERVALRTRRWTPLWNSMRPGKVIKTFGGMLFIVPICVFVDRVGNVWVTDNSSKDDKGQQVIKFSPDGKELMRLGKPGVGGDGPDTFNQPDGVVVASNGDIFRRGRPHSRKVATRESQKILEGRDSSSSSGESMDRGPASLKFLTGLPSIPREEFSLPTAITSGSRSSTRMESFSKNGSSSASPVASSLIHTTFCM